MRRRILAALTTACLAAMVAAEEVKVTTYKFEPGMKATARSWPRRLLDPIRESDLTNPTAVYFGVVLSNAKKTFPIRYAGRKVTGKDGKKRFVGTLGWPKPQCNWYPDGFFRLTWNGFSASAYPFRLTEAKSGEPGVARFTADLPAGKLIYSFSLQPDDDKLLFTVKIEPKEGVKTRSVKFQFNNYPSAFGKKTLRRRALLTAKRGMAPDPDGGSVAASLTKDEPWVLVMDKYYDVANKRGAGPSALAFDPTKVDVTVRCGGYRCCVNGVFKRGVEKAPFVLWDFAGVFNADAVAYMKSLEVKTEGE